MDRYVYLSITPEALICSMLPPEEFGNYLAVGTKKRTRGQAIFFEIDQEKAPAELLPKEYMDRRCVTQADGQPKHSVYLSIYRVFEKMPLEALKSLYLTTDDGRVLELKKNDYAGESKEQLHLYQELCPVTPRVASTLAPDTFMKYMTNEVEMITLPKLMFVELDLNGLANDPEHSKMEDLPYPNVQHLRDCLMILKKDPSKLKTPTFVFSTKTYYTAPSKMVYL
ncbi:MAG: hypothetical protein RIS47_223 [Bacteroidota bacterium]